MDSFFYDDNDSANQCYYEMQCYKDMTNNMLKNSSGVYEYYKQGYSFIYR